MFRTGLSMLWESTDAHGALHDRFGFDTFDDAVRWLTETLAGTWAIRAVGCDRIVISNNNAIAWLRTDQGALVVKWSRAREQFPKFAAVAELIHALHQLGLPVAGPLACVAGGRRVIVRPGSAALSMTVQPTMPGRHLDVDDGVAVYAAGACLARLHQAMVDYRDTELLGVARTPTTVDLHERIQTWLSFQDTGTAPAASARLRSQLAALQPIDTPAQLLHSDYRGGNLLTVDSRITAVLDFDEVALDYRVYDIARSCVYLATLFTDWLPTTLRTRRTFLDGYRSVLPLSRSEQDWVEALTLWIGIRAIPPGPDPAGWARAL